MTTKKTDLLILPGDGIGPEIMPEVRKIATWFQQRQDDFTLDEELYGIAHWKAYGTLMRDETWAKVMACDAILFGATGSPEYETIPAEFQEEDWLLRMRRVLDLYTNFRPIRTVPGMEDASTLRPEVVSGTDMIMVRELCGGLYFGSPRGITTEPDGSKRGVNTLAYTTREVERIGRAAFDLARTRQKRVVNVDKSNVLEVFKFWRETMVALHQREYPDIELTHLYVDNCAMQLVRNPRQFDVLVTENLFGDILSDCGAMVAGSLGMLPSASLGAPGHDGRRKALYEPIHGSAPDIAGKSLANPCGAILSFALCLRYTLDRVDDAKLLEDAVDRVIGHGVRTADIAPKGSKAVSTQQMGDAILAELNRG
jgi:3-isopropylmalate dehydrogenase